MNNPTPATLSPPLIETQQLLAALQAAVTSTLERKRRLGHYAVVWQDGRPVAIGEDRPLDASPAPNAPQEPSPC
ncbi:hypothetical protein [Sphaerotilus sp.]|uniref:hypothetical protein n=1 Tax=Sphaerotilus sp. TaxID=2093942 RepID=UPI002ACDD614|nr:hypothetical protein [Sphaerotilus sp.]MDZ7856779.1 hypothetical protein [Sphaerotilus sp.]